MAMTPRPSPERAKRLRRARLRDELLAKILEEDAGVLKRLAE